MTDSLDMHRKLQKKRKASSHAGRKTREFAAIVPFPVQDSQNIHPAFLAMEARHRDDRAFVDAPVAIDMDDVIKTLDEIHANYSAARLDDLIAECRTSIISTTANAFGLGAIISGYDKHGGNVTTVNNAKKGIYAREDIEKYNRGDYTSPQDTENYRDKNISENFTVIDEYTGHEIYYKGDNNRSSVDADHIVSTGDYHANGGFIQSKSDRREFGKDEKNMALMLASANRSKGKKDLELWLSEKNSQDPTKTNKEFYGIDPESKRVKDLIEKGKNTATSHAPTKLDWTKYYSERVAVTGAKEAGKMGLQQAMGLLLTNLFDGLFCEIRDIYGNGFVQPEDEDAIASLKRRAKKVLDKILRDWKSVVVAFRDGAISGFLSNLVTVIINTFVTTAKNIVRMIREGFFSLLKAVKLILFPPKDMTWQQACDAALKLIATGGITIAGIALEEGLGKLLEAHQVPFGGTISTVVVGGLTGISAALAVYALDDLDVFGIRSEEKHKHVIKMLESAIEQDKEQFDLSYAQIMTV